MGWGGGGCLGGGVMNGIGDKGGRGVHGIGGEEGEGKKRECRMVLGHDLLGRDAIMWVRVAGKGPREIAWGGGGGGGDLARDMARVD